MKIIYLLLIVCLGLATAKYLPNESASLTQLRRQLRSIEDDSAVSNENKSDNDDDSDDDTSEEEQLRKIEEQREEFLQKQEERKRKLEEKLEKAERKRIEKIEKEERKRQERLEKEERKRQENIEKQKRKQEEADRKQQEKIEKEERKRLEKIRKQLEELEKDTLENNKIPDSSSESEETDESSESLDLEDIWRNHIYAKYGVLENSTDLERKVALNKYFEEELGLNSNSTKSERRVAVIKLIQNNLNTDSASQDAFRNYMLSHINAVAIQQLRAKLENKIAKLNNESGLLENATMPWVPEAKQTIDEKRTLIQSVLQFLSHLLPNWVSGGPVLSSADSNTTVDSQGHSGSSAPGSSNTNAPSANEISSSSTGVGDSGAPGQVQHPAAGSVDVNSGSDAVAPIGAEDSSAGSIDTASNNVSAPPSSTITTGTNEPTGNIDSASAGGSPSINVLPASGSPASGVEVSTADTINSSIGKPSSSNDNSVNTEPASVGSTTGQESASSSNNPSSGTAVSPSQSSVIPGSADVAATGSSASGADISAPIDGSNIGSISTGEISGDNSVVNNVPEPVNALNSSTQESVIPSGEAVPGTGPADVAPNVEAPTTSSIDVSPNGVPTPGNSADVTAFVETGSSSAQDSTTGVNKPTTTSAGPSAPIDGSSVGSTGENSGDNSVVNSIPEPVNGPNSSTQESLIPSAEAVLPIGSVDVVAPNVEPTTSSIDVSSNGVSTPDNSAGATATVETGSSSAQESTTGINKPAPAGAGPSEPVDVPSTGTIALENPGTGIEPISPVTESVGSSDTVSLSGLDGVSEISDVSSTIVQEPVTGVPSSSPPSSVSASAIDNIDAASTGAEQPSTGTVDTTQVTSKPSVIVPTEGSNVNSFDVISSAIPEAGPNEAVSGAEVSSTDTTNVDTPINISSTDALPNTGSPNLEATTGSDVVVTESSTNVNSTEANAISNVSNSADATTIVVDVPTPSPIPASSVSGVSEPTNVEVAPTSSTDVIVTEVSLTPEMISADNSVTPGLIIEETVAPTTEVVAEQAGVAAEQAGVAAEAQSVPEGGDSTLVFPNEPGASVIEITPQ